MIDLSIIIPVYNAGMLIERCLDSIFGQQTKYSYEVLLIDDGSTDNSVELIRQRKEQNIMLLQQSNSGPAKARNRGLAAAKGKFTAFLDADDYWKQGFVEKTLDFLHAHKECIAVSVSQKHITMSGESIVPNCINEYNSPLVFDDFFEFWARYFHVCTGSIAFSTDVARKIGGQREDLRICEDLEFWAMLATYGRIGFIPEVLFVSDGLKVTNEIGWVEKNKKRWASAPTIENWERRLITRKQALSPYYVKARGRIARNLCYSMILSKRIDLAYQQIRINKRDFPKGLMTTIFKIGTINRLAWKIITSLLIYREYHR